MSIELLPFSAFALESCAAPAPAPGEGQTLTLPLRIARSLATEPMSGRVALHVSTVAVEGSRHAGVVAPADVLPLTITF
jgi:hypothetical protein